eukprot:symbB.v1.2.030294.t1/scaffold3398.1/size57691/8
MAEREDGSESPERSQQNVVLKMSMKGMSIDSIADVLTLEPCDVVRILEEAKSHPSQDGGNKATKEMVKRLMTDPPELCCPVSKELMEDPVVAGDGFTYERSYIEGCLKSKKLSPMTGKNIETQVLNPNQHLKTTIYSFKESTVMGILNVAPQLPVDLLSPLCKHQMQVNFNNSFVTLQNLNFEVYFQTWKKHLSPPSTRLCKLRLQHANG